MNSARYYLTLLKSMNKFLTKNYDEIILMSKKICKGSSESEDVAHFAIAHFMEHERGQELVDSNRAMNFLSGIMWRSFNSSTSQYHTLYRQKGRVHSLKPDANNFTDNDYVDYMQNHGNRKANHMEVEEYNHDQDKMIEVIQGILEDMSADTKEQWFRACLFQMYVDNPNYSDIARTVNIPRTSIRRAVDEAKEHIRLTLKNMNLDYEL